MALRFHTRLRNALRKNVLGLRTSYLKRLGFHLGKDCRISFKASLDMANPDGIRLGDYVGVSRGALVLAHDFVRNRHMVTTIGSRSLIGAHAIIFPGVTIGEGCIIAPGAVVSIDIPANSVVLGNPGRIIERDIRTAKWGVRIDALAPDRIDPAVLVHPIVEKSN